MSPPPLPLSMSKYTIFIKKQDATVHVFLYLLAHSEGTCTCRNAAKKKNTHQTLAKESI